MPKSFQKVAKKVSIPIFLHKKRMPKSIRYYKWVLPWVLPFDFFRKMSHIQDSPFHSKIKAFRHFSIVKKE